MVPDASGRRIASRNEPHMTDVKREFRSRSANGPNDLSWLPRIVDAIEADIVTDPSVDLDLRLRAISELRVAMSDTQTESDPT
jgi:hypothetical protein